jgi:hypothetical protein
MSLRIHVHFAHAGAVLVLSPHGATQALSDRTFTMVCACSSAIPATTYGDGQPYVGLCACVCVCVLSCWQIVNMMSTAVLVLPDLAIPLHQQSIGTTLR